MEIWNLLTNDLLPSFPSLAQPFDNTLFQPETYSMLDPAMSYQTSGMNASNGTLRLSPDMTGSQYGNPQVTSPLEIPGEGLEALTTAKAMLSDLVSCKPFRHAARPLPHILTAQSTSVTSNVSTLSSSFLDLCLQMFWTRFLPTFPIIHPATFDMRAA
jgi:hypothetical protein